MYVERDIYVIVVYYSKINQLLLAPSSDGKPIYSYEILY